MIHESVELGSGMKKPNRRHSIGINASMFSLSKLSLSSSKKVEKKGKKTLVFFVKFAKRLITMQKNIGTKTIPNITFVKILATLKRIVGTRNGSKQFFVKNRRKKGKKTFSLLLNLMFQQKAMNVMLTVVVVII